jgi:hypothetical protein
MLWIILHLNARQRIVAMNVMSTMARTWRLTVFWRIKGQGQTPKKTVWKKVQPTCRGHAKARPFSTELLASLVSMWGLLDYP